MSEQPDLFPSILWPVARAPYTGSSVTTIASSRSGSDRVTPTHGKKAAILLKLFQERGPLSLNECAERLGWPLSSICSLKAKINAQLVEVDVVTKVWASGKATTRTRWRAR